MAKQNNASRGSGGGRPAKASGKSQGASTGLRMSNERRADVTKAPTSRHPYPKGMC